DRRCSSFESLLAPVFLTRRRAGDQVWSRHWFGVTYRWIRVAREFSSLCIVGGGRVRHFWRALFAVLLPAVAVVPQNPAGYYQHVLFDNSLTREQYFYARAEAQNTSTLETVDGRLPVDSHNFHTPPNALRLQWQSNPNGGWSAQVSRGGIRNLAPHFVG